MIARTTTIPGFIRLGPAVPTSPVILAVPHAGRDYPAALRAATMLPIAALEAMEDRHADALVTAAAARGATIFIATRARCWIDLNRHEREVDPAMIDPPPPQHQLVGSAKVRGGLGLIPRRIAGGREIWRGRIAATDLAARIADDHRPWHDAIATALTAARARFGEALLLDCHSMPTLTGAVRAPAIVLGDRFGQSAASLLIDRAAAIVETAGLICARNSPYAGGHTLDRHGEPARGVHAIQIEVDRACYLAPDQRTPGAGLPAMAALIARIAAALEDEILRTAPAEAAE